MVFYFTGRLSPNILMKVRGLLNSSDAPVLKHGMHLFRSLELFEEAAREAGVDMMPIEDFISRVERSTEGRSSEISVSETQLQAMGFVNLQDYERPFMVRYVIPKPGSVIVRASEWDTLPLTVGEKREQTLSKEEFLQRLQRLGRTPQDLLWEGHGIQTPPKAKLTESEVDYLFL